MIVEINRETKPEILKALLKKVPRKRTLRPFMGKLKRGLDGMEYQNEARDDAN
jgi:hypothetical protein